MSNDEHVFLSDGLKDIIDLESLKDTYSNQKTDEIKYLDSQIYINVKFLELETPLQLEVFKFKKSKYFDFKILELTTNQIIQFLTYKIEKIEMKINQNQYEETFHCDNYEIIYCMSYIMKNNYRLRIKIKRYEDIL